MKKKLFALVLAAAFAPVASWAQSAIDGTWKTDTKTIRAPSKPSQSRLAAGIYECLTCIPQLKVTADGKDHPVSGSPYFDTMAVTVVDDKTIEAVTKKAGKQNTKVRSSVSADGNRMTREITATEANGTVSTSTTVLAKVEAGPPGAHAVSGSWNMAKVESMSDSRVTFKTANGAVSMTASEGASYIAQLDGSHAPVQGDPGAQFVTVKMTDAKTMEEVTYRDGKPWLTTIMTVDENGKTAKVTWTNMVSQTSGGYSMTKE